MNAPISADHLAMAAEDCELHKLLREIDTGLDDVHELCGLLHLLERALENNGGHDLRSYSQLLDSAQATARVSAERAVRLMDLLVKLQEAVSD